MTYETDSTISELDARTIAGYWHSGQWSALYSFSSSGYHGAETLREAKRCLQDANEAQSAELNTLIAWLVDAQPSAPFAVSEGLAGLYCPDSIDHCETIEDARMAIIERVKSAADFLADGEDLAKDEQEEIEMMDCAVANLSEMPADELAKGFAVYYRHSVIELSALDPADYEPEGDC